MGHNGSVRRSFAGLLFGVAFAFACLAISGFLLHRTAFSPSRTGGEAASILQDEEVQREAIAAVADATADQMYPGDPTGAALVRQNITIVASTPAGAPLFGQMLADAHAVLIGDLAGPVVVTPETGSTSREAGDSMDGQSLSRGMRAASSNCCRRFGCSA